MVEIKIKIVNEKGFHARPAALLVNEAKKYDSKIIIEKDEKQIDAKSMLGLLTLGLSKGAEITIKADGEDEEQAVNGLVDFISNFTE